MGTEEMILRILQACDPHTIYPCLDTPYSKNYSNTNFIAWGQDIHAIRGIVSERQEQINLVDTLIERTEAILVQLREKHEHLVSSKKVHEIFLSCIRRLPSEVLREIFLQCLPPEVHVRPIKEAAPLLLTQVCKRWREIALDTPRLWCSLSAICQTRIVCRNVPSRHCPRYRKVTVRVKWDPHLPFYDDWLKRAKFCPLSLRIDISEPPNTSDTPPPSHSDVSDTHPPRNQREAAIDLFRLYTSRSRELSLILNEADCLPLLLHDLPILEHLFLEGNMRNLPTISIAQPQPQLRTLIIRSPTFGDRVDGLSAFNPGWTNLTHLAMMFNSSQGDMFLMLLQMCPNLEHFVFSPAEVPAHDNPVLLIHSKLRVLELDGLHIRNPLADKLTLPQLCSFQVGSSCVPFDDNRFCNTSVPKQPPLHTSPHRTFNLNLRDVNSNFFILFNPDWLDITHLTLNVESLNIILQAIRFCPNLKEARILIDEEPFPWERSSRLTHHQLHSLTLSYRKGSLDKLLELLTLPSLCHLEITHLKKLRWPHGQFKAFVARSRFPLQKLTIEGILMYNIDENNFMRLLPTLKHVEIHKQVRYSGDWSDLSEAE